MSCCTGIELLSPQEARIEAGRLYDIPEEGLTPGRARIYRMLERLREQKLPRISMDRAKLFTESMKETEGEHLDLRWAQAMMHIARNIPICIEEDTILAGRCDGKPGRHGIIFPELEGGFLDRVADAFEGDNDIYDLSSEDAQAMREMAEYWRGRTLLDKLYESIPPDTRRLIFKDGDYYGQKYIITQTASTRSSLQWVPDYSKVINRGFADMRREAAERLAQLDTLDSEVAMHEEPFLKAVIMCCDAMILFAHRYADLAEAQAKETTDPKRRKELERMAATLRHVPEFPARNFYEAVQAHWIFQCFSRLEQRTSSVISNGRLDQLFYPFYKADKEAGTLTDDEALEILENLWLNIANYINISVSPQAKAFYEGHAHWEAVTIGGKLPDGRDATNDLTYLILQSKRAVPLNYPDLAARIHSRSPERYLMEVAETIKEGSGFPKIFNDEEIIPLYLQKGVPLEVANDYSASGCSEVRLPNWDTCLTPHPWLNLGSVLEMTLNNGRLHAFNNELYGLETGDARNFKTFEELFGAFKEQLYYMLKNAYILVRCVEKVRAANLATPLFSLLHDKAFAQCLDLHSNEIKGGASIGFYDLIGLGTVLDSFAAIKKFVFEEKRLTMQEVCDALDANFEGYENVRALLKTAPKYGNNDPYVDSLGYELEKAAVAFSHKYRTGNDTELDVRYVPVTSHIPLGRVVGAMPNGRLAGTYLSEGSSASHGADTCGPTAVLLSNANTKYTGLPERAARLLNIKLSPASVANHAGSRKLIQFLRAFCDLKLWHVQFNVINRDTMLKAQKNPDQYKNLLVRVAGYSAYFVDLSPGLQGEIIDRAEHAEV
ncbi:pyruvate formate lyase family protein [Desulfovibrio sp.]|uniref:(2S)-3-sulfopropanediol dehydratase n=1 Tax=Desulfovibrio sp. TaxID=885 RepID=UPI0025BE608B|nr:pyruvate formate lyase family protein [Desulfovibrio sp.]